MAGNIKGITIELNGDTTKLDKALRSVNRETQTVQKQLQEVEKALKMDPGNADLIKQKERLLGEEIESTKRKLEMLRQADEQVTEDMENGVDGAAEKHNELQRQISTTEAKEKMLQRELDKLKEVPSKIDQVAQSMAKTGEKIKNAGDKMKGFGKSYSKYVTAPLTAAGTVGAKKFAEVDKTMQLTNATMKNTEEQAELLNQAMKDAAANSTFGMSDAATATLNFARAGLTAEQAASALAPAMNLAAGEGGDLETVSAGLVATINGFAGSFDEASTYADIFANACNNSALDIDSLSEAMSVAAPIFHAAGYSVQDAALYMGTMANAGIDASTAANALKTGMARLVSPAKDAQGWLNKLGVEVTNADGSMKDSVTVQRELHDAFSTLSESEQLAAAGAIFGKNQMSNWLALINTAPEDVAALNSQLSENGTTTEMATAMMSGFGGSMEKLKSGIDVAATSLGEALAPIILKVANGIQLLVDWFNSLSPTAKRVVAVILLIVAAIGPLLVIIGTLMSSIGSIMTMAPKLLAAFAGFNPMILVIIAAITALIAVGVWLYKNWDTIKAKAIAIKESVVQTWNDMKTKVIGSLTTLKTGAINAYNTLKTGVTNIVQTLVGGVVSRFNALKSTVASVWNNIKSAIISPMETAKSKVSAIVQRLKSFFPLSVGRVFSNIKLPHFKISGGTPPWGIGGKGTKPTIGINWYKTGAIFDRPSVIGVGEAGPEAVVPIDTLWNKLDNITRAVMDTRSEATSEIQPVTIVVQLDGREIARVTAPHMESELNKIQNRANRKLGYI